MALKLLNPDIAGDEKTIERFRNELKLARAISHRNVCRMYDLGREEGTYCITTEYVSGEDLKSLIHRIGALPVGKLVLNIGYYSLWFDLAFLLVFGFVIVAIAVLAFSRGEY
jgi:serine/threonine protein kinase